MEGAAFDFFQSYEWPGNIRELKNVVNYAYTISSGPSIGLMDLPKYLLRGSNQAAAQQSRRDDTERSRILEALISCRYNKTKAAEILDVSRRTLYNKIEKYGIGG